MEISPQFHGRLGLQQRVLPVYRAAFCETLHRSCQGGLNVFAGSPLPGEGIASVERLEQAKLTRAGNWQFSDPGSAWYFLWQFGILKWLKTRQPDALVVEANPRYLSTRLAVRWMHQHNRPVIGWGLGSPPLEGAWASIRKWERLNLIQSLDAVIAYSQRGAEQYRGLGLPVERVFVATNAVEPPPAQPPVQRLPKFTGRPVVLFVGRLQKRKRIDNLLQACAGLPSVLQPRLLIVGDGPARQEFEALAREIYPSTEFTGAKYGAELDSFFDQADLFVLPGTGGLAVQQAMAHALPVIVAQGDGTQDDIVRPNSGWQVPPGDLPRLQQNLRVALSSPENLRQMGMEAYRIVKDEVNIESMARVFVQVVNSACLIRRPPAQGGN